MVTVIDSLLLGVFPVSGGWCEWSEWTPCSRTCGAESVSRYRNCGCPKPKAGGAACSGEQDIHHGVGVQIQRQPCPVIAFCPGRAPSIRGRQLLRVLNHSNDKDKIVQFETFLAQIIYIMSWSREGYDEPTGSRSISITTS